MGPRTHQNESVIDSRGVLSPKATSQETTGPDCRLGPVIRELLLRVVLWSLLFGVVHMLGFRAYTSLLSGTADFGLLQRLFGAVYLVLYAVFVLLVPVLIIAAGLLKGGMLTRRLWMGTNKPEVSSTDVL